MTNTEWHVGRELWQRYVRHTLDYATESAVEAHVDHCAECRLTARAYVDPEPLELAWSTITTETERPQHPVLIRGLLRLGGLLGLSLRRAHAASSTLSWLSTISA